MTEKKETTLVIGHCAGKIIRITRVDYPGQAPLYRSTIKGKGWPTTLNIDNDASELLEKGQREIKARHPRATMRFSQYSLSDD